jgi:hypothetical protein
VTVFEAGWRLLYEDVSLRVCDRLIATLADVRHLDSEIARDLDRLRRRLLSECPVLPEVLPAMLAAARAR